MTTIGASSAASTSRSRVARAMANGSTGWSAPSSASAARTADARAGARRSMPVEHAVEQLGRGPTRPARPRPRPPQADDAAVGLVGGDERRPPRRRRRSCRSRPRRRPSARRPGRRPRPAARPAMASTTSWRPWSDGEGGRRGGFGSCRGGQHGVSPMPARRPAGRLTVGSSAQADRRRPGSRIGMESSWVRAPDWQRNGIAGRSTGASPTSRSEEDGLLELLEPAEELRAVVPGMRSTPADGRGAGPDRCHRPAGRARRAAAPI